MQLKQHENTNNVRKLENKNVSLKRKLEAEKMSWDNIVVIEKDNILLEILHLDKKLANLKMTIETAMTTIKVYCKITVTMQRMENRTKAFSAAYC